MCWSTQNIDVQFTACGWQNGRDIVRANMLKLNGTREDETRVAMTNSQYPHALCYVALFRVHMLHDGDNYLVMELSLQ